MAHRRAFSSESVRSASAARSMGTSSLARRASAGVGTAARGTSGSSPGGLPASAFAGSFMSFGPLSGFSARSSILPSTRATTRSSLRSLDFAARPVRRWFRFGGMFDRQHRGLWLMMFGRRRAGLSSEPPAERLRNQGRLPPRPHPSQPGRPPRRWLRFVKSNRRRKMIRVIDLRTVILRVRRPRGVGKESLRVGRWSPDPARHRRECRSPL